MTENKYPHQKSRHPSSERFYQLLAEIGGLHADKQKDYGTDSDPFANVRTSSEWGMPAWVGAMVRATDKIKRLQTFARRGWVANETAVDSFKDLAVYAIIGLVLFEEEQKARGPSREQQVARFLMRNQNIASVPNNKLAGAPSTPLPALTKDRSSTAVEEEERFAERFADMLP
jgi:hypothetical protein